MCYLFLDMRNEDFWRQFPKGTIVDIYTCKACGQPLYLTWGDMDHCGFSHKTWHECQREHIPDPIIGWLGNDNEYMQSWKEDLICWLLTR